MTDDVPDPDAARKATENLFRSWESQADQAKLKRQWSELLECTKTIEHFLRDIREEVQGLRSDVAHLRRKSDGLPLLLERLLWGACLGTLFVFAWRWIFGS